MKIRKYYSYGKARDEIILTREEQEIWYADCLKRVLSNVRFYLDNLETLVEFKVNWQDYHKKGYRKKYLQKQKVYKEDNTDKDIV